jgi:hypothetical protein
MEKIVIVYGNAVFYVHLVNSETFWCSLWSFGILFPVLECQKKNLATLLHLWQRPCPCRRGWGATTGRGWTAWPRTCRWRTAPTRPSAKTRPCVSTICTTYLCATYVGSRSQISGFRKYFCRKELENRLAILTKNICRYFGRTSCRNINRQLVPMCEKYF